MDLKRAIAIAASLLGASTAFGETGNVTLYGRLNMSLEVVNGKQSGEGCPASCPNPNVFRVSSNSSLVGFRGSEPLGRGLSAIFQLPSTRRRMSLYRATMTMTVSGSSTVVWCEVW